MNILIVNDNLIGENNAVGYCMKNMLLNMPGVKFMQYCIDYRPTYHPKLVRTIFCDVSDSFAFRAKKAMADYKKRRQHVTVHSKLHSSNSSPTKSESNNQLPTKPISKLIQATEANAKRELLNYVYYSIPCKISKHNLEIIKAFKPDAIYTLAENLRVINQAIILSKKLNIPVIYHGMDDWKATAYSSANYTKPLQKKLEKRFAELNKRSKKNIAICEKMADYYSSLYEIPYDYACNCITEYGDNNYTASKDNGLKIVFSGGLHLNRGQILCDIAELIDELNDLGYKISLEILCPYVHLSWFQDCIDKFTHTNWKAYRYPQKNKLEDFQKADILLMVESPRKEEVSYAKYSFSTKIPEYLAVGRCILAYGSNNQASIKYVEDMNCGRSVSSMEDLKSVLIYFYEHPDALEEYAKTAKGIGIKDFSQKAIQHKIKEVFKYNIEHWSI